MEFNIFSDEYAEALFNFVGSDEHIYDDMAHYMAYHDCSMAEFVNECYLTEFKSYLSSMGWLND